MYSLETALLNAPCVQAP